MEVQSPRLSPGSNVVVGRLEDESKVSGEECEHGKSQEQISRRYLNTLIRPPRT